MAQSVTPLWGVYEYEWTVEVVPEDFEPHQAGGTCWCGPRTQRENGAERSLIVHFESWKTSRGGTRCH